MLNKLSIQEFERIADETVGIKLPVIKNGNQEQPMYAHTACMINDQLSIMISQTGDTGTFQNIIAGFDQSTVTDKTVTEAYTRN